MEINCNMSSNEVELDFDGGKVEVPFENSEELKQRLEKLEEDVVDIKDKQIDNLADDTLQSLTQVIIGKTSDGRERKNETTGARSLTTGQLNKNGGWQSIVGGENNTVPTVGDNPRGDLIMTGAGNFLIGSNSIVGGTKNIGFGANALMMGENNKDWVDDTQYNDFVELGKTSFTTPSSASALFGNNNINKGFAAILSGTNIKNKGNNVVLIGREINFCNDIDPSYKSTDYSDSILVGRNLKGQGRNIFLFGEYLTSSFSRTFAFGQSCVAKESLQFLIGYNVEPTDGTFFSVGYNHPDKKGQLEVTKTGKVLINSTPSESSRNPIRAIDLESYTFPASFHNIKVLQKPTAAAHPIRYTDMVGFTFDAKLKSIRINASPTYNDHPIRLGDIKASAPQYKGLAASFKTVVLDGPIKEIKQAATKEYVDNAIANIPVVETDKTLTIENAPADAKAVGENLENKLDKVTTTTQYMQVYTKAADGTQEMITLTANYAVNAIPRYNAGGRLSCATPTSDSNTANKKYVDDKFNGSNKAVSFINYSSMISSLNSLDNSVYNVGQNVMIITLNVPDLWVSEIAEESNAYTYISDDDFISLLSTQGYVQVGYYKLSALETQKVDLTDYVKTTDYATNSKAGLVRAYDTYGFEVQPNNGIAKAGIFTAEKYETASPVAFISKGTLENIKGSFGGVDVQINGTSIVENGVANIPIATDEKVGVARFVAGLGTRVDTYNRVAIVAPTNAEIDAKTQQYKPIVPYNLDYAVKKGLTTNTEVLTDEEKAQVQAWLGTGPKLYRHNIYCVDVFDYEEVPYNTEVRFSIITEDIDSYTAQTIPIIQGTAMATVNGVWCIYNQAPHSRAFYVSYSDNPPDKEIFFLDKYPEDLGEGDGQIFFDTVTDLQGNPIDEI